MTGPMLGEYPAGPAHPALAGDVVAYCGYVEHSPVPVRRRELPGPRVPVIISFGDVLSVRSAGGGVTGELSSFVAGFHDTFSVTEFVGGQCGLQVDLTPLGAHRLLGLAGDDLRHGSVRLSDVVGRRDADDLVGRLVEAPDWASRFALADAFLLRRAQAAPTVDPEVGWAWERLCRTGGRLRVGTLAAEVGWSRRHLAGRFRRQVGLGPKEAARVLRFARAVRLLGTAPSLSDLAADLGYADHSHLVREFRALAGCPPSQLAAELRGEPVSAQVT
ncbi:helix-turn-helix domain-containing protein [Jiangella rhizosphaerae]|uniref:AraC family transcriptional regulator n=1 Tax=Jiangella rhizosphaerae TaxID=2293569 RepID=A0A418KWH9_9ACTN|nr:AraC family transcriptional regulator [Jiangella rhizosphaerae]RIQ34880.1 AraC family transcriptional regulator [Jiangella rhizosphaerae]